jgi:taurine dioxygenase
LLESLTGGLSMGNDQHTTGAAGRRDARVVPLTGTIGARVENVDAAGLDDASRAVLRDALERHHVIVLGPQVLTDDEHRMLASVWGEPQPHPVAAFMGSSEVIAYVTNDADNPPIGDSDFHTDYTFNHEIAAVAVLQAQEVTTLGGDTIWADAHAAYDALSESLRAYLATLAAHHELGPRFAEVTRRRYGDDVAQRVVERFGSGAVHPVVVRHPVTGRAALFVNPGYTTAIVGLEPKESAALLGFLFEHLASPRFHYRHHWNVGDVVIWDEVATVHQGPDDFWPERRVLRRITAGLVVPSPAADLETAGIPA